MISAPPKRVWSWLVAWERAHEWMPRVERLSAIHPDRPLGTGSLLRAQVAGAEVGAAVVRFDPPNALAIRWQHGTSAIVHIYLLDGAGRNTRLTLELARIAGVGGGGLRTPLARLLRDPRAVKRQLSGLKRLVEQPRSGE